MPLSCRKLYKNGVGRRGFAFVALSPTDNAVVELDAARGTILDHQCAKAEIVPTPAGAPREQPTIESMYIVDANRLSDAMDPFSCLEHPLFLPQTRTNKNGFARIHTNKRTYLNVILSPDENR